MTGDLLKVAFRVLLVTGLFAVLGFALGGLVGILSIAVLSASHAAVNAQNALWFAAIPGGIAGSVVGLIIITVSENRARGRKSVSAMSGTRR